MNNETKSTATTLYLNSPVEDCICCPDSELWYKFTPSVTANYIIRSLGSTNVFGCLYKSNDDFINNNNITGNSTNFLIENELTAGQTYYLCVESNHGQTGAFSIIVERVSSSSGDSSGSGSGSGTTTPSYSDNSNTMQTAVVLAQNTPYTDHLCCPQTERWYKFTPNETAEYIIRSSGSTNVFGCLLKPNGDPIINNNITGGNTNFTINQVLTAGQTYYLCVESNHGQTGAFSIIVERVSSSSGDSSGSSSGSGTTTPSYSDNSNTMQTAVVLAQNTPYTDHLCCPETVRWYKFIPSVTAYYNIYTEGKLDTIGSLYDSNNSYLTGEDLGGEGANFNFSHRLFAGNTYFICVQSKHNSIGEFSVCVEFSHLPPEDNNDSSGTTTPSYPDNSNTFETAIQIYPSSGYDDCICCPEGERWYKFVANSDAAHYNGGVGTYHIFTLGSLDTVGTLYNSNKVPIVTNYDGGDNLNFNISQALSYNSTYYICVRSNGTSTGEFQIRIEFSLAEPEQDSGTTTPSYTDCGNTMETAVELSLNNQQEGCICCPEAEMWYKFTPNATSYYTVYTSGSLDTVGYLYDANGNYITSNDDGSSALNFKLVHHLNANQTYYIKVKAYNSNTGRFNICLINKVFVESITLNYSSIILNKGSSTTLSATVYPTYSTDKSIYWESSNTNVVTVNSSTGKVTAVGGGTACVCAYAQDGSQKHACCEVSVNVLVESVTVDTASRIMHVGTSSRFTATVCPENATDKSLIWTSSNTTVASVDSTTGYVTAKAVGTANIYATAQDGTGKQGVCVLTVEPAIPVQSVTMCCDTHIMNVGETTYLSYDIYPSDATNKNVVWCSSNPNVAEVDASTGKITAKSKGTSTITITTAYGSVVAHCLLTVVGYNYFDKANTNNIKTEFINLLGNKKTNVPIADLYYINTTEECLKTIINYDIIITEIANEFNVSKAFIQTILMRELWCLNLIDIAGDALVENYYMWKESCEYWENQDFLYQTTVPFPNQPPIIKTDSSVGLGQIFALTAISAYNSAINHGHISGTIINSNDWHECKKMWYSLKNDDEYNIKLSALNILSCIDEFNYNYDYNSYSIEQCKHIFTRYNANTHTINDYGHDCYQYYLIFKKYL